MFFQTSPACISKKLLTEMVKKVKRKKQNKKN